MIQLLWWAAVLIPVFELSTNESKKFLRKGDLPEPSITALNMLVYYNDQVHFHLFSCSSNAANTLFASTHLTTECDLSQGAGPSGANHMVFQLHCYGGWAFLINNLYYVVIWVCEPNISAVCPLPSSILCFVTTFVYCHGWLCGACPVAWLNWYDTVCVKIIQGEKQIKQSAASKQQVGDRPPLHS